VLDHRPSPNESRRTAFALSIAGVLAMASLVILSATAAQAAGKGRWSPNQDWRLGGHEKRYAAHMILQPGDGAPYHSRILWFRSEEQNQFMGGQWGWTPGNDGCVSYPNSNFTSIAVPLSGMDLFCAGQALIGPQAAVVGGTSPVTGAFGENKIRLFSAATGESSGEWSAPDSMQYWRWYPTVVPFRGRVLALAGNMHRSHRMFGGFRDGAAPSSPNAALVHRQQPVPFGTWDPTVFPLASDASGWPAPRYAHTVQSALNADVLFGGRDSAHTARKDVWRLFYHPGHESASPTFLWDDLAPSGGTELAARSDHSAITTPLAGRDMVIYGGLDDDENPLGDVWRLFSGQTGYEWAEIDVTSSTSLPPARYGHTAIYDETVLTSGDTLRRMIVFGGSSEHDASPTDLRVWELRFHPTNPAVATWYEMTLVDLQATSPSPRPAPRLWHSMNAGPGLHSLGTISNAHVGLLYGGKRGSGAYSDSLWGLWILRDGTVGWQLRATPSTGASPGARARHSAAFDFSSLQAPGGRLYVFGGETASGPADSYVYAIDTWKNFQFSSPDSVWKRWQDRGFSLSAHSVMLGSGNELGRIPEVYDPNATGNKWTALTSAPQMQLNYPPSFVVPGAGNGKSRIISINADTLLTYALDVAPSGQPDPWQKLTNGALGFRPRTGVQYLPGNIVLAGGDWSTGKYTIGSTVTLDASSLNNSWVVSDTMKARVHHNLVLLPTGQVLVVGGNDIFANTDAGPVRRPQIWTPNSSGGGGTWTSFGGADTLAEQPTARTDHSTAILLPDGRVLSAGGETPADKYVANLYCPPYLYKSDGATLAARPSIARAPRQFTWGQNFTLCTPERSSISRVCLIAPAATTHSVDMNQRYVPLSFTNGTNADELSVTAPASPDSAPPGYYMLFITGSADGPDVPSIATWVQVGSDDDDSTAPATNGDLAPDMISSSSISLTWTAPADDGSTGASGVASAFDLRHWTSAISNESQWNLATQAICESTVGPVGTEHGINLTGLPSCTWHYFQLRTWDDRPQLSGLHGEVKAKTTCSGGGGGLSVGRAREEAEGRGGSTPSSTQDDRPHDPPAGPLGRAPAQAAGLRATIGVLYAESARDPATGRWTVTLGSLTDPGESEEPAARIESRDASGAWRTVTRHVAGLDDAELLVPLLRHDRRIVFPAGFELGACGGITLSIGGASVGLASASSSSRGALDTSNGLEDLSLATGETVSLVYEPIEGVQATVDDAVLSAVRHGASPTQLRRRPAEAQTANLHRFALHGARPNPAGSRVSLEFELPQSMDVRLEVFDLLGRKVQSLVSGRRDAGVHRVDWDRSTAAGARLAAGIYVVRLSTPTRQAETKVALIP